MTARTNRLLARGTVGALATCCLVLLVALQHKQS